MTAKDYKAIAEIIRANNRHRANDAEYIALEIANYFALQNPRFIRSKFLQACGIE